MKRIFTAAALLCSVCSFSQKVIVDQVKPISGDRQIITDLAPIFKAKAVQVAALAYLSKTDTVYTEAFYYKAFKIVSDAKADTSNMRCTILLKDGNKIVGKYTSCTTALGYTIYSYRFSRKDFESISGAVIIAVSLGTPAGPWEFTIDKKYQASIGAVSAAVIRKI